MKSIENQPEAKGKSPWKQSGTNMVRYIPSGTYYARFRVNGKLIWRSLKTPSKATAKLRFDDLRAAELAKAEQGTVLVKGNVLFEDALKAYRENGYRPVVPRSNKDGMTLKPASISYYEQRVKALFEKKSWPELKRMEIRKITERDCLAWSKRVRGTMSATAYNHTVGVLRNIIDYGVHAGARYGNPARSAAIRKAKEPPCKLTLQLPNTEQFEKFISVIENGGSGWSKPCADLVRFLAFGGFRKTEAEYVTFADCDFERSQITVRGHPETGLKNRGVGEVRHVPMIPEMQSLLERIKAERPEAKPIDRVMLVNECQKSMNRAAEKVGMARITHHDMRHLWATRCIESGVDIPTLSRWLGHSDGGNLCMLTYGHLRDEHSASMAAKVRFSKAPESKPTEPPPQPENVVAMPQPTGEVVSKEQTTPAKA